MSKSSPAVKRKKKNKKEKEVRVTRVPNCRCLRCQAFAAGEVPRTRRRPLSAWTLDRILRKARKGRPRPCVFETRAKGEKYTWSDEKSLFPCVYMDGCVPKPWQHNGRANFLSLCDVKVGATLEAWRNEPRLTKGTRTEAGNSWAKTDKRQNPLVDAKGNDNDREDLTQMQLPHADLSREHVLATIGDREHRNWNQIGGGILTHEQAAMLWFPLADDAQPEHIPDTVHKPNGEQPLLNVSDEDHELVADGDTYDIVRKKRHKPYISKFCLHDERVNRSLTKYEWKELLKEWEKRVPEAGNRPKQTVADSTLEHRRVLNEMSDSELAFCISYLVARDKVHHRELFNELTAEQLGEYLSQRKTVIEKRERMLEDAAGYALELLTTARPEGVRQVDTTDDELATMLGISRQTAQRRRVQLHGACSHYGTLLKLWQRFQNRNPQHKLFVAWQWARVQNFAMLEETACELSQVSPEERLAVL